MNFNKKVNDAIHNCSNKNDSFILALIRNELIQMQKPNLTLDNVSVAQSSLHMEMYA